MYQPHQERSRKTILEEELHKSQRAKEFISSSTLSGLRRTRTDLPSRTGGSYWCVRLLRDLEAKGWEIGNKDVEGEVHAQTLSILCGIFGFTNVTDSEVSKTLHRPNHACPWAYLQPWDTCKL